MKSHILVVDKDLSAASRLRNALHDQQYAAHVARRGDDALALLSRHPVKVLIANPSLSDHTVQWLYHQIGERYPSLKEHVIFLVDDEIAEDVRAFIEGTGNDILATPFEGDQLDKVLSHHVRH
jgi:PleD family two-component response regulator